MEIAIEIIETFFGCKDTMMGAVGANRIFR